MSDFLDRPQLRSLDEEYLWIVAIRAVLRAMLLLNAEERFARSRWELSVAAVASAINAWFAATRSGYPVYRRSLLDPEFHAHDWPEEAVYAAAFYLHPGGNRWDYSRAIELAYQGLPGADFGRDHFVAGLDRDLDLIAYQLRWSDLIRSPLWLPDISELWLERATAESRIFGEYGADELAAAWFRELIVGDASPELAYRIIDRLPDLYPFLVRRPPDQEDRLLRSSPPRPRPSPPPPASPAPSDWSDWSPPAPASPPPPQASPPPAKSPPPSPDYWEEPSIQRRYDAPSAAPPPPPAPLRRLRGIASSTAAIAREAGAAALRATVNTLSGLLAWRTSTTETESPDESGPSPRYTDISIFAGSPERRGAAVTDEALIFAKTYTVEVAIRQIPIGLPAMSERPDVTPQLSQTGPSELLVVLTSYDVAPGEAEDFEIPYPVQRLVVPVIGDSPAPALFQITPRRGTGAARRCSLMLRLYYNLDLVDQQRITLAVGPTAAIEVSASGSASPLSIDTVKARTLPDFASDLSPRSLNIVVSRPSGGSRIRLDFVLPDQKAHFVGNVDISRDDLSDLFSKVRDRLLDIALCSSADTIAIDAHRHRDQLQKLAQLGEQAKQLLFDFGKTGNQASLRRIEEVLHTKLASGSIVQIAIDDSASDFRFPWSILFCGADPRNANNISDFWGYRFVIEEKPARLLLVNPLSSARRELSFAVWDKLTTLKAQRVVLDGGPSASPPVTVSTIDSRADLVKALKNDLSDILYIFAHGHSCAPSEPAISALLEKFEHAVQTPLTRELIKLFRGPETPGPSESDDSWIKLTKSLVTSADLRRDEYALNRHPIVFLNMCQSAVLWPGVTGSFIRLFLDRQASAVLGTECTIPENVADEFGRLVIGKLFQGESIGLSLLHAREQLAHSNNILGLAYSLYGSASAGLSSYKPPH